MKSGEGRVPKNLIFNMGRFPGVLMIVDSTSRGYNDGKVWEVQGVSEKTLFKDSLRIDASGDNSVGQGCWGDVG